MTAKQERFCEEYVIDGNGTQAAIRAGYSAKTAGVIADELLKKPNIQEKIRTLRQELAKKAEVTAEEITEELKKIGFSDLKNYVDSKNGVLKIKKLDDKLTGAIQSLQIEETRVKGRKTVNQKIKLYNKIDALVRLGQHIGYFEKDNAQKKAVIRVGFSDEDDDE